MASKKAASARPGYPQPNHPSPGRPPKGEYGGLPPRVPQRITLFEAIELTHRYRKAAPASEHGGFFWAEGLQQLLAQPGCVGMRYYHGLDAGGTYRIVLVGVDQNGNDITEAQQPAPDYPEYRKDRGAGVAAKAMAVSNEGGAVILDRSFSCPPMGWCPPNSPL